MGVYRRGKSEIFQIRFVIDGRKFHKSSGTSDRREAVALERRLKAMIQEDIFNRKMDRPLNRTLDDALDRWEEAGAPDSMMAHRKAVRERLGGVPLGEILLPCDEWVHEMQVQELSPCTINRRIAVVKRALSLAYTRWRWLTEPLHLKVQGVSEKGTGREVFLTAEEVRRLLGALRSDAARDALLVAAYTGLRRGELLSLRPENIRSGMIVLQASATKAKKARSVPIHPAIAQICERLPIAIRSSSLRQHFDAARVRAGLPHVRWHDLRHTFASWLAEDPTVPMAEIRDLLGHSSLTVTNKYAHLRTRAAAVHRLPSLQDV
jgi:integrase